jgi:type VI protein secretion system component VasF
MNKIEAHMTRLFKDIPDSERKKQILQEITQDLEDKVADLMAQGKAEEDAVTKALVDFGDIDDIKAELVTDSKTVKRKSNGLALAFSIWGSALIILLVLFINFYYTPHHIWFVYPTFAVIWWPMSLFFHWLSKKREDDEN